MLSPYEALLLTSRHCPVHSPSNDGCISTGVCAQCCVCAMSNPSPLVLCCQNGTSQPSMDPTRRAQTLLYSSTPLGPHLRQVLSACTLLLGAATKEFETREGNACVAGPTPTDRRCLFSPGPDPQKASTQWPAALGLGDVPTRRCQTMPCSS